ncbi:hypothetical protein KBTX_02460 [wastewater metagenome]|uniref:Toprim domain-containing protein n=2 Tax=unclassified sequences TaxID=12908 RepID=A0A5B8RBF1_9ZZZZ|nr:toprim domain-containing protein [Arhodomonas sp. KWT]QEA06130.1 hypothetical protein KBTEX_02460 [uncultured organism]
MREEKNRPAGYAGQSLDAARRLYGDAPYDTAPRDPVQSFRAALADAGIPPHEPADVVPDGRLHRYRVEGNRAGTRNGWYVLHLDGVPGGAYGSWRAGVSGTWCARDRETLTPAERDSHRQRMEAARAERDREQHRRHLAAAGRAARIWSDCHPADPGHPYLGTKGIPPLNARQRGDRLVLPVVELQSRRLTSLQFIGPDGTKNLLSGGRKRGCVIPVAGRMPGASRVLICEGWATGATLAALEPDALVLAAIDAGNLHPVATAARREWPDMELVICADADPTGVDKARAAAIAAEALVAVPMFPEGIEGSDWNDYVAAGLGEVEV